MSEPIFVFRDIALIFAGAFLAGIIFFRLRQPLILGYVLAGLLLSPLTPGPRVHDVHVFQVMAEAGVILLMFSVGIEFSIPELLRVRWIALVGAPLGISLCIGLGIAVGALLGWPFAQGVAVGCIVCVASTMVLMRQLMDSDDLRSEPGRLMVALTLVEDLAVVVIMVLLPHLKSGGGVHLADIAWQTGKALLLLAVVILAGWKIIPRVMARVEKTCNQEISLLFALTVCLVVAAITEWAGFSLALGAFVGGMLLGSSSYAHTLAAQTQPLRDAFVALFFVTVGMLIDPGMWISSWRLLLVLVGLIVFGKFAVWFGVVRGFGYSARTAVRVGAGLTQIGEFSFILAQLSLAAGLITPAVYSAALTASLVTILANAFLVRVLAPRRVGPPVCD